MCNEEGVCVFQGNLVALFRRILYRDCSLIAVADSSSHAESDQMVAKITEGVKLAFQRLIERTKKEDGELVISKNGKIVRVKARDLNSGNHEIPTSGFPD